MKLRSESTLAEVADCLTDIGEAATLAQLQANAYLVVFPWVDTGAFGYDTARLFEGDESGELSAHEVRETVKARAAVRESLSREEAFLLPVNAKHPATERLSLGRARDNDLVVNIVRDKKLTNMRASGSDENYKIAPPRPMSLEEAIAFINDDELVEVTPKTVRLRKYYLREEERKQAAKRAAAAVS